MLEEIREILMTRVYMNRDRMKKCGMQCRWNEWPLSDQPDLLPPLVEKQVGRPKKHARRKSTQEIEETKAKLAEEKAKETGKLGRMLKKKHLAEQSMANGGGSSSGTGPTVIVQNTQSSISKAMRTLKKMMALLLGPPSSGKTTLLLALAGRLDPSLKLDGEITYNGHKLNEFEPRRTSAYISQNDIHVGELTVKETPRQDAKELDLD
ncbi:transcription factor [Orobanche minor]